MIFTKTKLNGAYVIDIERLEDERGFFGRTYCAQEFEAVGLNPNFIQTNVANNKYKGTLRGLHMQLAPYGEIKLIRCTRGAIYDVIVDLRKDSPTFKQWIGVELTAENNRMLLVPQGCAHGYLTLEDETNTTYQVSQLYQSAYETGVRWNDPTFNIVWPVKPVWISEKDKSHADFSVRSIYFETPIQETKASIL